MNKEILEVTERVLNTIRIEMQFFLVFNNLFVFIMITFKEWIDSFNQFCI